jgi:hypothetical protein
MHRHEYNLHIQHVSGADNFLADIISRNPAGLCERDTKEHFKPNDMMVAATNLDIENAIEKSLKELSTCPARNKRIQEIIRIVEQKPENASKMAWCRMT